MMRRLCQLLRRVLDFYLEPAPAQAASVPAQGLAPAAEAASGAVRLQDLGWGSELKEDLLKRFPDLADEEIEEFLRQV